MKLWRQVELAHQGVAEILHFGQVRTLVVLEDAPEEVDFRERLAELFFLFGLAWCIDNVAPESGQRDLLRVPAAFG